MADPFLRWAGGKRWLVPLIQESLQGFAYNKFFEPFVGGGAMLFALEPKRSEIGDINSELINTYTCVRDHPKILKRRLTKIPINRSTYNCIRAASPTKAIDRAIRFIYLNRTCFCGLYRVNRNGNFNVPYGGGTRTPLILTESSILEHASQILHRATIRCADFEETISNTGAGDLLFCDPTYARKIRNGIFDRYNDKVFSWEDQCRLANACRSAVERGASIIVTNIHCREIRALYRFGFSLRKSRRSVLCSGKPDSGVLEETVIFAGERLITHLSDRLQFRSQKVA